MQYSFLILIHLYKQESQFLSRKMVLKFVSKKKKERKKEMMMIKTQLRLSTQALTAPWPHDIASDLSSFTKEKKNTVVHS